MAPHITIRNVTSTPIELVKIERFEAPEPAQNGGGDGIASITRNFTTLLNNVTNMETPPTAPKLAEHAKSFKERDLAVTIGAFDVKTTDIPNDEPKKEIIRLTFENDGQRYRVNLSSPPTKSAVLQAMAQNPKFEYTAVYNPDESFLSLFSSAKLNSWMKELRDGTALSALSIPGTHNSPTHHKALPSVRCQAVGVREQLNNGVRYLDIRVQPEDPDDVSKEGLILVHSAFPISLTGTKYFRETCKEVRSFLNDNPSETVIISLKREGTGRATDQHLSKILRRHYAGDTNLWFTEPRVPRLGEARGKIVLLRRFMLADELKKEWDGRGWGINGAQWPDNCADGACGSGQIRVQDFYEVEETKSVDTKISYAEAQLTRAAEAVSQLIAPGQVAARDAKPEPLFVNFLSASNFWKAGLWPEKIAAKINPQMVDFLCRQHDLPGPNKHIGDGSTGIVVCDWVGLSGDWELVRCIVGMNTRLVMKQHGH